MNAPRRGSLLVIFLTVFIDLLGFGMVLPLLPIYAKQFTTDKSGMLIGLLMASFSAMQFLFAPMWGRLSDRIGRRPVLMIGLGGSVLFYTLFGFATIWKSLAGLFVAHRRRDCRRDNSHHAGVHCRHDVAGRTRQGNGADRRRIWRGVYLRAAVRLPSPSQR